MLRSMDRISFIGLSFLGLYISFIVEIAIDRIVIQRLVRHESARLRLSSLHTVHD